MEVLSPSNGNRHRACEPCREFTPRRKTATYTPCMLTSHLRKAQDQVLAAEAPMPKMRQLEAAMRILYHQDNGTTQEEQEWSGW